MEDQVLKQAQLQEFIKEDGLAMLISENGNNLSSGEK